MGIKHIRLYYVSSKFQNNSVDKDSIKKLYSVEQLARIVRSLNIRSASYKVKFHCF